MPTSVGAIKKILGTVTKNVYHLNNLYDNVSNSYLPFIVWQETNKRGINADNHNYINVTTYQITLVTKLEEIKLQNKLEGKLREHEVPYQMISSFTVDDYILHRVYHISMIG
ncbi:MAG: hypothetical protein FWE36_00175 [Erysipelotrichales bacterium]|nr:hypothetical protein [Erysipelotrichales bacterium]